MSPVEEPNSPDYEPSQMDQEAESAEVARPFCAVTIFI